MQMINFNNDAIMDFFTDEIKQLKLWWNLAINKIKLCN